MTDIVTRLREAYLRHGHSYMQEAADEIERLRARLEIDPAHPYDGIATRDETIRMQDQEIDALRAEVEALRVDAERFAWTKENVFKSMPKMDGMHYWYPIARVELWGNTIEAAIDAAKGKEQ